MAVEKSMNVLAALERDVPLAQACDTLISSLSLVEGGHPLRSVLVTSAQPEEGKTTVAVCLALRMAATGKRTLVVDADLRRPMVHQLLRLDNSTGLMDVVAGDVAAVKAIREVDAAGTNGRLAALGVLTSGRSPRSAHGRAAITFVHPGASRLGGWLRCRRDRLSPGPGGE
jgi:Mrp family chromosome partitioning ATPase